MSEDIKALLAEAEANAEKWYAIAEHLWRKQLGHEPSIVELWAFRGQMIDRD